jgi:hypothetical protein
VKDALKRPYAEIQLKRKDGFETAAITGDPGANALRLPLVYGGETVGRLVLAPRVGEENFGPTERRLLEDLSHQIGASAHAALMTDGALRLCPPTCSARASGSSRRAKRSAGVSGETCTTAWDPSSPARRSRSTPSARS